MPPTRLGIETRICSHNAGFHGDAALLSLKGRGYVPTISLTMAVRAVSIARIRGAQERTPTVWNPSKASAIATQVLIEYIGVAAQFVVADALQQTERSTGSSNTTEELMLLSFLINLGSELPASVPTERVRSAIIEKYQRG